MGTFTQAHQDHIKLQDRAQFSRELIETVRKDLSTRHACTRADLCIFTAGSLARHEVGRASDLDLFFVSNCNPEKEIPTRMSRLEEFKLFAELILFNEQLKLEPFSGDGEYLKTHDLRMLIDGTGSSEDDSENMFTTRLLLLLESAPLAGDNTYEEAIERVLQMYFRDDRGRKDYRPLFLLNDVLRYWRTLCLNYERSRKEPGKPWWKRNLNLKFPRKLSVFSTVLAMIAPRTPALSAEEFKEIARRTPMERLAYALDLIGDQTLLVPFTACLDDYEYFLAAKSHKELDTDEGQLKACSERAQKFDDLLHAALSSSSIDPRLTRYVMI